MQLENINLIKRCFKCQKVKEKLLRLYISIEDVAIPKYWIPTGEHVCVACAGLCPILEPNDWSQKITKIIGRDDWTSWQAGVALQPWKLG